MTREYVAITLDKNNRVMYKYFKDENGNYHYYTRTGEFSRCLSNSLAEELRLDEDNRLVVITDRKEIQKYLMIEELQR